MIPDKMSEKKQELQERFEETRYWLGERAKNTLKDLEVYQFSDFYRTFIEFDQMIDFKSVRNCGAKTEKELNEFVTVILHEAKDVLKKNNSYKPFIFNNRTILAFAQHFDQLGNRAKNVLNDAGANTLKGFNEKVIQAKSPEVYILKMRNCGITTKKEILAFASEIEKLAFHEKWQILPNGVFADIDYAFFQTNLWRKGDLLLMRNYFCIEKGRDVKTLVEISKELNLTRERVRQISISVLKKLKENILRIVEMSDNQIPKYFIQDYFEVENSYATNINTTEHTNFNSSFISYVLAITCPIDYDFINIGQNKLPDFRVIFVKKSIPLYFNNCYAYLIDQKNSRRNEDLKIEIKQLIDKFQIKENLPIQRDNALNLLVKKEIIGVLKLLVDNLVDNKNKIQINLEFIVFERNTKKLKYEYLVEILREFGRPMHFSELEQVCKEKRIKIKSVLGAIMRFPDIFGLKGQGTYGLIEWGGYFGSIGDVAEQILRERNGPISWIELRDFLARELVISEDSISVVLFFYEEESRFVRKGSKVYLQKWLENI